MRRIKGYGWPGLIWLSLLLTACSDKPTPLPVAPAPTSAPSSNITFAPPTATPAPTAPAAPTVAATPTSAIRSRTTTASAAAPAFDQAAIKKALGSLPGKASASVILPDGQLIEVNAEQQAPSASTIKLWVAATVFEQGQNGALDLSAKYQVKQADIASGTGILRSKVGTSLTLSELISTMLIYSDNSATNILLDKLGGFEKVNAYITANGYPKTKIQRRLGFLDPAKENYTDAHDAALFMQRLLQHKIVDEASSGAILQALQTRLGYAQDQNFFGPKLPKTAVYRHLSGTGTGVRNEVGFIQTGPDLSGPALIISIYTNGLPDETAAETAIATAIQQIWDSQTP